MDIEKTVKLIGWASLAIGAAEILSNRKLSRTLGLTDKRDLLKSYGTREIASGVGILATRHPTKWMWGRVAGDVADLAALTPALRRDNPQRNWAIAALVGVLAVFALDVIYAQKLEDSEAKWHPH